jgi:hypothetical protein
MKKLSFKQAEKLHKELWGWLAETGAYSKGSWPKWEGESGWGHYYKGIDIVNDCFACMAAGYRCNKCPITWKDEDVDIPDCTQYGAFYTKWIDAKTPKTRKKYAAVIRDLPWRKMK